MKKIITLLMFLLLILSMTACDSESILPVLSIIISGAYLVIFGIANKIIEL